MMPTMPSILVNPLLRGADLARYTLGQFTWGPALALAKTAVLSAFSNIEIGTLLLVDSISGTRLVYGQRLHNKATEILDGYVPRRADDVPRVELVVLDSRFWMRLWLFADIGFADSYLLGEVECRDLTAFFHLFLVNRDAMSNGTTWFSSFFTTITRFSPIRNTMSNALLNAQRHYDASNELFSAFLSPDLTYSCPIWQPLSVMGKLEETLEEAQMSKLHKFIDGIRAKPSDHVLEIGTGWGSFALELVHQTGCRVTSVTLSKEQKTLAEERIRRAGLDSRIEIKLMDYRDLPVPDKPYDKIVSIEMIEAVGKEYLSTYFAQVHRLLKIDGGIAMFQCITIPEGRYEAYSKGEDFIRKYVFPGGHLPSITQLLNHINTASQQTLLVERVENIGPHYCRALRIWRDNFLNNFRRNVIPALRSKHPDMTDEEVQIFRRKWEYYLSYSEAGFKTKTLGDFIITVAREGSLELMEDIPL